MKILDITPKMVIEAYKRHPNWYPKRGYFVTAYTESRDEKCGVCALSILALDKCDDLTPRDILDASYTNIRNCLEIHDLDGSDREFIAGLDSSYKRNNSWDSQATKLGRRVSRAVARQLGFRK